MILSCSGVRIYYERFEGQGTPVLMLHGWGGSHISFEGLYKFLVREGRSAVNIDFPAFGGSDTPKDWGIYEYAACVRTFMTELGIDKAVIVGHSFGGRVGLILASEGAAEKLVLVDSAGLKPRRSLKTALRIRRYKRARRAGKDVSGFGSADYRAADPALRSIFVRVVNQYLDGILPLITCPTLIVWGRRDTDTPLYMARRLHKKITNSGLVLLEGGHYAYVENYGAFTQIIKSFID